MDVPNALKILVVEDDAGDVVLLRETLKHAYIDFEFWHVRTVMEAVEFLQKRRPDVVILDLSLPDGVGVEVVHRMHACAMQIPIVVLTGREDEALALICLNAGAQDFLSKSSLKSIALRRSIAYALSRQRESDGHGNAFDLACYQGIFPEPDQGRISLPKSVFTLFKDSEPHQYAELTQQFHTLFSRYLDHLILKKSKPCQEMSAFVSRLISLGGGARDLIALQIEVVGGSHRDAARLAVDDGEEWASGIATGDDSYATKYLSFFGLELMVMLAETYRANDAANGSAMEGI